MGQGLAGGRDSRPKHNITAWTKKSAEILHVPAFVRVCASVSACICAQKIKHLDTSRRKKFLRSDASFVQGLSGCTILQEDVHGSYIDCLSNYRLRACGPNVLCHIQFATMIKKSCILLRKCVHLLNLPL